MFRSLFELDLNDNKTHFHTNRSPIVMEIATRKVINITLLLNNQVSI